MFCWSPLSADYNLKEVTAQRDEPQTAVTDGCWLLVGGEMHHQQDEQQQKQLKHIIMIRTQKLQSTAPSQLSVRGAHGRLLSEKPWLDIYIFFITSAVMKKSKTEQNDPKTWALSRGRRHHEICENKPKPVQVLLSPQHFNHISSFLWGQSFQEDKIKL